MKNFLTSGVFFLATLVLAMGNDQKIISDSEKYSLTQIVEIKKILESRPTTDPFIPFAINEEKKARMVFDKNYPCIMFSTVEKKFIPEIRWGYFREGQQQASPKFDVAFLRRYHIVEITNSKGEQFDIPCNNIYDVQFSQNGLELFGNKLSDGHCIFAKKINDEWVVVSPEIPLAKNFEKKRGYYIRGKEIIFVEDPISEEVRERDFYVGFVKDNELIFTEQDGQRNYVHKSEGLLSPNKKFLAQRIDGFMEVSQIKIANDILSLSVVYKTVIWKNNKVSNFALTDEGTLLFYDGQKSQVKGSGQLTNEHFLLMMLVRVRALGAVRPYSFVLARLAHNLVDKGIVNEEIVINWQDRSLMLKYLILDVLDDLNRDARFIKDDMAFIDEDYEFRNTMLSGCKDREQGNKLLQKFALQFYGPNYEHYSKNTIRIIVYEKITKLMQKIFPKDFFLLIVDKYKLFCVHDFIDELGAQ